MQNKTNEKCPFCGSVNIVASDADGFKKSNEPLILFLFALGFVMVLFACFSIAKLGFTTLAVFLFTFFVIGFIAQYLVRNYLDKKMITTFFCQDCHKNWSK